MSVAARILHVYITFYNSVYCKALPVIQTEDVQFIRSWNVINRKALNAYGWADWEERNTILNRISVYSKVK
jgi:hypothetical protein